MKLYAWAITTDGETPTTEYIYTKVAEPTTIDKVYNADGTLKSGCTIRYGYGDHYPTLIAAGSLVFPFIPPY